MLKSIELNGVRFRIDEVLLMLEISRHALRDAGIFDEIADTMDQGDEDMKRLRDKITQALD